MTSRINTGLNKGRDSRLNSLFVGAISIAFLCLCVFHFHFLLKYSVNVPIWDEWEALSPGALSPNLNFQWLFQQHNEHRIILTKGLTWALYKINGWNLATNIYVNFFIYLTLLGSLTAVVFKEFARKDLGIFLLIFMFSLSPLNHENHFWGFQSQFHFVLLSSVFACHFLFRKDGTWISLLFGSFFAILGAYSFSTGVGAAFILVVMYSLFTLLSAKSRVGNPEKQKKALLQWTVACALIGVALVLYLVRLHRLPGHPVFTLPNQLAFWGYYLNLLSFGFGVVRTGWVWGLVCLLLLISSVFHILKKYRGEYSPELWILGTYCLIILASLTSIAIGRAGFGSGQAKSSRYFEMAMLIVPIQGALLFEIFKNDRRKRLLVLGSFWLCCFLLHRKQWNFEVYSTDAKSRIEAVSCISKYIKAGGPAYCPTAYPGSIADRLETAKTLKISFLNYL